MVQARQFRADLYYRLAFLKIQVPPLRQRPPCIPALAAGILRELVSEPTSAARSVPELHPEAMSRLQAYAWPGNIRELEQALTFAVTFFPSPVIRPEHLPPEVANGSRRATPDRGDRAATLRYSAPDDPEAERSSVMHALEVCKGNRTRAAKALGMSRATLWIKLRQFGSDACTGATRRAERSALLETSA